VNKHPATGWEYVQVSLPDQKFTEELTMPSLVDMPFSWPTIIDPESKSRSQMPKEEVIRIVDFVRKPSSYGDLMELRSPAGQKPYELPILQIRREGDKIHVTSGFQHGGLWGRGWMTTVECTATGYKVTKCGRWTS
jgi:hypothetical protein